ncbi:MAG: SusC/RagA family TonB-linked outer membrane protein [Bacteroidales bacterium]|nr:SusC/RagA family TonB-linked outer membrane protein [Bacteroidales bacterium]HKL93033.1 SusC/RagA family TonB-linked outer membrane protein [Bacteroidales bacterium]
MRITRLLMGVLLSCGSLSGVQAQDTDTLRIEGTVVNASTGGLLAGARLLPEKGRPVMTGDQGTFLVKIPVEDVRKHTVYTIAVEMPGYASKRFFVSKSRVLSVELFEEGFSGREKSIVTPWMVKKESELTNTNEVIETDLSSSVASSPDGVFQGTVSGLNTVYRSGQPGSGANMYLQGFNSLMAGNQPLIVLDGVPYENSGFESLIENYQTNPMSSIEVKDIESISIMKDGTGIYGGKGANGVIFIQTIRAKDAATQIEAHVHAGMSFTQSRIPLMNANQYRTYLGDLLKTSGLTNTEIEALPYFNQDVPVADQYGRYSGNLDYWRYANNTDWQNSAYQMAWSQNYNVNIKGGDETALYALSLGYLNQEGVLKNTAYDRFNVRFNSDIHVSKKLEASTNMSFSYGNRDLQNEGAGTSSNLLYNSMIKAPFMAAYKYDYQGNVSPNLEDDDLFGVSNVEALNNDMMLKNGNYRFLANIKLAYTFNKNWGLTGLFGLHFNKDRERIFIPALGIAHDTLSNAVITNEAKHRVERWFSLYGDVFARYEKIYGVGNRLQALLGARFQDVKSENDYGLSYNSSSDDFKAIGYGDNTLRKMGGSLGHERWVSIYGNADYLWNNRILLNASIGSDLSSRYDGMTVYPSVAAAWLLHTESFMEDVHWMDRLKWNVSFNTSGNDNIGNYSNRTFYINQNLLGYNGLVLGGIPNADIKPEYIQSLSTGLQASLLNERLNVSLNAYQKNVRDMLTLSEAPDFSGFDFYLSNGGAMKNTGIDLTLQGRILNQELKWDMGLTLSTYRNEVTRLDCGTLETEINGALVQTKVGQPIGVFYGYKTDGIFSTQAEADAAGLYKLDGVVRSDFAAGDVRFVDVTGEKEITAADRVVIGDPNPDVFGAWFNTLSWKAFQMEMKWTYSLGGDVFNYSRSVLESMSGFDNQAISVMNRWRVDGQHASLPKATWGDPMGNARFSDRWIEDGSYVRLKTLSFSYNVPQKYALARSLKLFVTGENLLTFTGYKGLDPEFSQSENPLYYGVDAMIAPQPKALFLGVKIGL